MNGGSVATDSDVVQVMVPGGNTGAPRHYTPALPGGAIGQLHQPVSLGSDRDMSMYEYEDEEKMKLRAERAPHAGGWGIELSKKRALEEALG